jgi:hypothetical protein
MCVYVYIQELFSFLICLLLPFFCATVFQTLQEEKTNLLHTNKERKKKCFFPFMLFF